MKVIGGKVAEGKVVVNGEPLVEGSFVTVLAREALETFTLGPDDERELVAAMEEADRRDVVDAAAVLKALRERT